MLMRFWDSLLMSEFSVCRIVWGMLLLTNCCSQNQAVLSKASQCFTYIAQALEAETLQGNTAQRAVAAARKLIQLAGLDANQILANMPAETQQTVRAFFG